MTPDKPLKRDDVIYKPLGDENLLVDTTNKKVHSLNVTANFVWNLCDGHHRCRDISQKLAKQFDVKEVDALKDVEGVVAKLQEHSLLKAND
ncbi:MAG: Radical protein [Candidatus Brocadiaceae bacterium]|nr:Radical protein [Candidatus Brocadiaceae bacterium]